MSIFNDPMPQPGRGGDGSLEREAERAARELLERLGLRFPPTGGGRPSRLPGTPTTQPSVLPPGAAGWLRSPEKIATFAYGAFLVAPALFVAVSEAMQDQAAAGADPPGDGVAEDAPTDEDGA